MWLIHCGNKKEAGQITVEASIIVPIVMLVVMSFVYLSMYVHDVITVKCYFYKIGIENKEKTFSDFEDVINANSKKIPLFVVKPTVVCSQNHSSYVMQIKLQGEGNINWINKVINQIQKIQTIKIEKDMSRENLYITRAVCDGMFKGGEN